MIRAMNCLHLEMLIQRIKLKLMNWEFQQLNNNGGDIERYPFLIKKRDLFII